MSKLGLATMPSTVKVVTQETNNANKNLNRPIAVSLPYWPKTITQFPWPVSGVGNVLPSGAMNSAVGYAPVLDQNAVRITQPYGTRIPTKRLDRTTGYSQVQNVSHTVDLQKVQGAFRAAENGDTRMLFTYYRDFILGNGTVVAELSKRKLSTISEKYTILPNTKGNKDDEMAAKVIEEALNRCPTFQTTLIHLMNAVIYPVSVCEKMFDPIEDDYGVNQYNLRYKIKEIYPVSYDLVSYRLAYIPQFTGHSSVIGNTAVIPQPPLVSFNAVGDPTDIIFDPDSWEPDLRFWQVLPNGTIVQTPATMIKPDPDRHMVYRTNLLQGIARDNFGGLGKSLLFLSIMQQLGLNVFLQCLQKYGIPFVVAKVDMSQVDTVNQLTQAFGDLDNILRSITVNKDCEVELQEINMSGAADAHAKFLDWISDRIALLISGQTLSSNVKGTGLGSGTADLHSAVRDDIVQYDRISLNNILQHQLFKQYLDINGIKYNGLPSIVWGGGNTSAENKDTSITLLNLYNAGIGIEEASLDELSNKMGYQLKMLEIGGDDATTSTIGNNKKDKKNNSSVIDVGEK